MTLNNITQEKSQICINNECINVELAVSSAEKTKGLMFRESLDGGMLFVYEDEERRSFWMKNTLISLDIIFINKDKEIVFINENTEPCKEDSCANVFPEEKAMYVLELNSWESKRLGIKVGDKVKIPF